MDASAQYACPGWKSIQLIGQVIAMTTEKLQETQKKRKTVFVKIHAENQMTANMFRKHNDILLRPCLVKGFVKRVSRRSWPLKFSGVRLA